MRFHPVAVDCLALVLIVVLAIGLQRLLKLVRVSGEVWAEALLGPKLSHIAQCARLDRLDRRRSRVVFGAVFLMPAITSLVASVFVDDVADHVEARTLSGGAAPAPRCRTASP